jgi:prevent-host-death family protein
MGTIGLFEAKTKLSELCREVSRNRKGVVITHRGKPLVRIEPIQDRKAKRASVWDAREAYIKKHGLWDQDFQLPSKERQIWRDPLED